jgi:hypothetical protein
MNNAFEILMFLTLFLPVGLIVALNFCMYAEARYMRQPPAPLAPAAAPSQPVAAEVVNEFDFRQAA